MALYFPENRYKYTATWFLGSELRHNIMRFIDKNSPLKMLEIGSYEGLSACGFADNLMDHPDSRLDCVDPFDQSDSTTPLTENTEHLFNYNIANCKYPHKINVHKMYSNDFFSKSKELDSYDFIYIDGSHVPEDVVNDMVNSFALLKKGGIIWMDDYASGQKIKNAIDTVLLTTLKDKYDLIHYNYQIAFRKI
jgi:predicted O-methyltransferase YrrM